MSRSCVYRDLRWPFFPADLTWLLKGDFINPLNCGQYVNNETPGKNPYCMTIDRKFNIKKTIVLKLEYPCNVAYQECDLPIDRFPIELRCYLPNIYYSSSEGNQAKYLRIVALVATKDIEIDTELFSTYYTVVHDA